MVEVNISMRAYEFINESKLIKTGIKPHKDILMVMPGTHRVAGTADRLYDLNRIMLYVAMTDGESCPSIDSESWAGRNNTAHPYTPLEVKMLKKAYQMANVEWDDVLSPNEKNKSLEPNDTYSVSPINGFKGYKRK